MNKVRFSLSLGIFLLVVVLMGTTLAVTARTPTAQSVNMMDGMTRPDNFGISEALGPSISLDKTVGTNPSLCSSDDEINVPVGTTVTYCYTATNTGSVIWNYHTLVDDQFGELLIDTFNVLTPGESVSITVTTVIDADVVNTATWTVRDEDENTAEATDTASVTVYEPGKTFLPMVTKN